MEITEQLLQFVASSTSSSPKQRSTLQKVLQQDSVALSLLHAAYTEKHQLAQATARHAEYAVEVAAEYKALAAHYQTLNNQHAALHDNNIDTLIHLATLLSTNTAHPNQLILSAAKLREGNASAQSNYAAALADLNQTKQEAREAERRGQLLAALERIEIEEGVNDFISHNPASMPPTNKLAQQTVLAKRKQLQHRTQEMKEKKQLKETIELYGASSGRYSLNDLDHMLEDIARSKSTLQSKTQYLAALEELESPDLQLAEFRLQEGKAEYAALQKQLEEIRVHLLRKRRQSSEEEEEEETTVWYLSCALTQLLIVKNSIIFNYM